MTVVVGGISGSIQDVPRSELDRVLDGLRALGLDRHTIAGEAEGTASLARSPDRVPVDRLVSAFACAERMSGDVNVGLHTAAEATLDHWVTYVAESQSTLGDAIDAICRFQSLLFGARPVRLSCDQRPRLMFHPEPSPIAMGHTWEFYVATLCMQLQACAGAPVRPREIRFAHPARGDTADHRRLLANRVLFGCDLTTIEFESETLRHPLPRAHEQLARSLEQMAVEELGNLAPTRVEWKVRDLVRSSLLTGSTPNCGTIARQLGTSVRTLQRQLASEGQSFRRLLDEVRRDRAVACAANPDDRADVKSLAETTGFSGSSAFSRAFRRWTGARPTEFLAGQDD